MTNVKMKPTVFPASNHDPNVKELSSSKSVLNIIEYRRMLAIALIPYMIGGVPGCCFYYSVMSPP